MITIFLALVNGVLMAMIIVTIQQNWQTISTVLVSTLALIISFFSFRRLLKRDNESRLQRAITIRGRVEKNSENIREMKDRSVKCVELQQKRYDSFTTTLTEQTKELKISIDHMADKITNNMQAGLMQLELKLDKFRCESEEGDRDIHKRIDKLINGKV